MNINEIKEIISLIDNSELSYFEFTTGDTSLKMDKSMTRSLNSEIKEKVITSKNEEKINIEEVASKVDDIKIQDKEENIEVRSGKLITSPMVGTFYAASSPESDPFVSVGDKVQKGKILCIIEAMKLMNEIESEESGTILEILVKDGDMVEYGTPLFRVEEA